MMKYNLNSKKITEITVVSCICGVIFCIFCAPIIIYATSDDITPMIELGIDWIDIVNCTQQVSSLKLTLPCIIAGCRVMPTFNLQ